MSITYTDICIRLRILTPQRQPLGGTVDIEFKRRNVGPGMTVKGANASRDIDVRGLLRAPHGHYQVIVTPTDVFNPVSHFVNIPASGFNTSQVAIATGPAGKTAPPESGGFKGFGTAGAKSQEPLAARSS